MPCSFGNCERLAKGRLLCNLTLVSSMLCGQVIACMAPVVPFILSLYQPLEWLPGPSHGLESQFMLYGHVGQSEDGWEGSWASPEIPGPASAFAASFEVLFVKQQKTRVWSLWTSWVPPIPALFTSLAKL